MSRFRASPYAKALHEVVRDQCPTRGTEVAAELERLAEVLATVDEFHRVMVTPMVAVETKTAILDDVLSSLEITDPVRRFAHVMQRNYRLQHLPDVVNAYHELLDRQLGRTRARVEVPGALSADQQRQLLTVLGEVVDATVVADFVDNPDLLAGFRIQVGSKVFDGSLIGQLEQLSRQTERV
jgi:F-type H+-transporting ATPase subunit delta